MRLRIRTSLGLVAMVPAFCAVAAADVALPGHPWVVLQFAGAESLREPFQATALGRMTADPEIAPALADLRDTAHRLLGMAQPEDADSGDAEAALRAATDLFISPWLLGVYGPAPGADPGKPGLVLVAELGEGTTEVTDRLRQVLAEKVGADAVEDLVVGGADAFRIGGGDGLTVFAAAAGRLFGASDAALLAQAVAADAPVARFEAAFGLLETGTPALRLFVDLEPLLAAAGDAEPATARALEAFKLNDLETFALEIGLDGPNVRGAGRLRLKGGGTGRLASLVRGRPLAAEDFAAVPRDAVSFSAARCDPGKAWDYLVDGLTALDPEVGTRMDAGLAQLRDQMGLDIERSFVRALGDLVVSYSTQTGGSMLPGVGSVAMLWTLRDEAAFREGLDKGMETAAALLEAQMNAEPSGSAKMPMRFALQSSESEGVKVWYLAGFPMMAPAVGVGEGMVILSLQPNACRTEIMRLRGGRESIASNPDFAELWARAPESAQSVAYEDLRATVPVLYQSAITFAPMFAASKGVTLDLARLPTAETIGRHMAPAIAWDGVDGQGLFLEWTSPVGIAGGGNPANPAVLAVAAGVALPAVARARDQARTAVCANHLKQVGVAIVTYGFDRKGATPHRLDELVGFYLPEDSVLGCEAGGYLYLAPGMVLDDLEDPATVAVAMDDAPRHRGGRNVLFADGHVEFVTEAAAMQILGGVGRDSAADE